ncbi:hypothetical protein DFH09DRAFT_1101741 [Mycena vulgaris]|nr:hypothetical protein DFH09DRAFT_1101741 [Mycena vulgaris]
MYTGREPSEVVSGISAGGSAKPSCPATAQVGGIQLAGLNRAGKRSNRRPSVQASLKHSESALAPPPSRLRGTATVFVTDPRFLANLYYKIPVYARFPPPSVDSQTLVATAITPPHSICSVPSTELFVMLYPWSILRPGPQKILAGISKWSTLTPPNMDTPNSAALFRCSHEALVSFDNYAYDVLMKYLRSLAAGTKVHEWVFLRCTQRISQQSLFSLRKESLVSVQPRTHRGSAELPPAQLDSLVERLEIPISSSGDAINRWREGHFVILVEFLENCSSLSGSVFTDWISIAATRDSSSSSRLEVIDLSRVESSHWCDLVRLWSLGKLTSSTWSRLGVVRVGMDSKWVVGTREQTSINA